jgi:hypothetical protein
VLEHCGNGHGWCPPVEADISGSGSISGSPRTTIAATDASAKAALGLPGLEPAPKLSCLWSKAVIRFTSAAAVAGYDPAVDWFQWLLLALMALLVCLAILALYAGWLPG